MTKALTYVEIDIPYCANIYGTAPCTAHGNPADPFNATGAAYGFANTNGGWTAANASLTAAPSGSAYVQTGGDPQLTSPAALAIDGAVDFIVRLDIERTAARTSGAWQGEIYYSVSGGHGFSESFRNFFADTAFGDRQTIDIDMTALDAGGSDWISHTITQIRLDLDTAGSGSFIIHGVSIGHYTPSKCFNSKKTCQDTPNYVEQGATFRFAKPTDYLPASIEAIPSISNVAFTPAVISLGADLGQRATLEITFVDHPHSDTGIGFDKYLVNRSYDPFSQGTFWGKFRARQPFLQGRPLRLINGVVGQALAVMETRHYVIESFDGPRPDGTFVLTAQDVLKLADGDRAQAPAMSLGYLVADVATGDTTITLTPAGVGSTYPGAGYLNLGGSEMVSFDHDPTAGNDANCILLLHMDGADASTTFTDSSSFARAATANGNAQIDTAQSMFGGASALFDGAGDWISLLDNNAWTPGGDFTVDCWIRPNGLASFHAVFSQGTDENNKYQLFIDANGTIFWEVRSAGPQVVVMSSPTHAIANLAWQHVALVRFGNVWTIYVNGVAVCTTTNAAALPNFTGTFKIGINQDGSANPFLGWIDEFRFSTVARWTGNFTPPSGRYASSADIFYIVRGKLNTVAATHKAQDRAQLALQYSGADVADIIRDLFVTYAGVPSGYIDLPTWKNETSTFLGNVYSAVIAEPTSVSALVSELVEQAALAIWWDDLAPALRLQVLRAVVTDAATFTPDNTLQGSLSTQEQPDTRLSRVQTYFGQINPLSPLTNTDNYRSTSVVIDADAEANYGVIALKTIQSRWIAQLGRTVADRLGAVILGRYRDPPRHVSFQVMRYASTDVVLGTGYLVESQFVQDASGAASSIPIQVTQLDPAADKFTVGAEEMLFSAPATDLANRSVIIDANNYNLNLRTAHDSIFPAATAGVTVTFTINTGVIVGSHSTAMPAIDVGSWPVGVTVNVILRGRIEGKGGDAAFSGFGNPGGPALYARQAFNLDDSAGQIWGGGGGGSVAGLGGGGAGGGAGQDPGLGYPPIGGSPAGPNGTDSTASAGGGGPGLPGNRGAAAGAAIDGVSYVILTAGPGDRRGGQIN